VRTDVWVLALLLFAGGCALRPPVVEDRARALRTMARAAGFVEVLVQAPAARRAPGPHVVSGGSGTHLEGSGLVVTAAHVASGPGFRYEVTTARGGRYRAVLLALDRGRDFALLCAPDLAREAGVALRASPPADGEPVLAFGSPGPGRIAVAAGHVRGRAHPEPIRYGRYRVGTPLALELDIVPGFSGGPVVDVEGELVGVLVGLAMRFDGAGDPRPLGVAYALPAAAFAGDARRLASRCAGATRPRARVASRLP